MTTGVPSSTTATQLLVVPRSIPMTFSAIEPLYSVLVRTRSNFVTKSLQFRCDVTVPRIQLGRALQGSKGLGELAELPENLAQDSLRGCIVRIQLRTLFSIFLSISQFLRFQAGFGGTAQVARLRVNRDGRCKFRDGPLQVSGDLVVAGLLEDRRGAADVGRARLLRRPVGELLRCPCWR